MTLARLGAEAAETALAAAVLIYRRAERRVVEIGPELRDEDEFRIRALPGQEVRDALLTGGADDEVGVGNAAGVELLLERRHVDSLWVEQAVLHAAGERTGCSGDLLPSTVVEGDDEGQPVVSLGELLRLGEQGAQIGAEILALPDNADAHVARVEVGEVIADEALEQAHEVRDLLRRPAPVLRREAI